MGDLFETLQIIILMVCLLGGIVGIGIIIAFLFVGGINLFMTGVIITIASGGIGLLTCGSN